MSATSRQRLAKGMRRAARVIGLGVTVFLFFALCISLIFRELGVGDVLVIVSLGIALAGCIVSWWREWLAGILLILTTFALVTGLALHWTWFWWWLGLLFLVAGVLFLISSWLSRPWLSRLPLPRRVFVLLGMVLAFLVVPFLFLLCVEFIGGTVIFFPSLHTKEVAVEIGDGWVKSEPAPSGRYNYITFKVTNVGGETHMFVVLKTSLDPRNFPVENGQVRGYAYLDEPEWAAATGLPQYGFKAGEVPPRVPPPTPKPIEGVLVAPGGTAVVERWGSYMQRFNSGTVLVLFCNCPDHYERGEYTTLTIR